MSLRGRKFAGRLIMTCWHETVDLLEKFNKNIETLQVFTDVKNVLSKTNIIFVSEEYLKTNNFHLNIFIGDHGRKNILPLKLRLTIIFLL